MTGTCQQILVKFLSTLPKKVALFHVDRWTDGRIDVINVIVTFHNRFANASINAIYSEPVVINPLKTERICFI
jgi:hypothetical protein